MKKRPSRTASRYVDGFVLPIPKRNLAKYRRVATTAGKIWMKHGALEYRECVGDDMNIKMVLNFPKLARIKRGEMVVFSWIAYRNRAHRDRVNGLVMKDPAIARMMNMASIFDMKRMAYGGFKVLVNAG